MMILAEISDKLLPIRIYLGAALLVGISAAFAVSFLQGVSKWIAIGFLTFIAVFLVHTLQLDHDLIGAIEKEKRSIYLMVSKYWIHGAVILAFLLSLIFGSVQRKSNSSKNQMN